MKRTVELDDTLQELVDGACEEVEELLLRHLKENSDLDECPELNDDLDYSGGFHEIVDSSVPVYTHEIDTIFYLHSSRVEEAFDNAGIGNKNDDEWPNGWKAGAIYCYIEQEVAEWYEENAEGIFEAWRQKQCDGPESETQESEAGNV